MTKIIIGLTGPMGAGKGEVTRVLQAKGFEYISLSSMVREEARRRGVEEEREQLMEVGNSMREEHGTGVLAKKGLEKIQNSDCNLWVVDGIRNPAEIVELKASGLAAIVGVNAPRELIVSRILKRARPGDATDEASIIAKLDREWGVGEPDDGQQMERCMEKVDILIQNDGTLAELDQKIISYYHSVVLK
jgi:dephospho-CoA kinase